MLCPIVSGVTSTSTWSGISDGSQRTDSSCIVSARMPPELRTPSAVPMNTNADAHGDLLAGHELLEVDVEDVALDRMPLDLADQRARRGAVHRELDDGAGRRDRAEELLDLARFERERSAARGRGRR